MPAPLIFWPVVAAVVVVLLSAFIGAFIGEHLPLLPDPTDMQCLFVAHGRSGPRLPVKPEALLSARTSSPGWPAAVLVGL